MRACDMWLLYVIPKAFVTLLFLTKQFVRIHNVLYIANFYS